MKKKTNDVNLTKRNMINLWSEEEICGELLVRCRVEDVWDEKEELEVIRLIDTFIGFNSKLNVR